MSFSEYVDNYINQQEAEERKAREGERSDRSLFLEAAEGEIRRLQRLVNDITTEFQRRGFSPSLFEHQSFVFRAKTKRLEVVERYERGHGFMLNETLAVAGGMIWRLMEVDMDAWPVIGGPFRFRTWVPCRWESMRQPGRVPFLHAWSHYDRLERIPSADRPLIPKALSSLTITYLLVDKVVWVWESVESQETHRVVGDSQRVPNRGNSALELVRYVDSISWDSHLTKSTEPLYTCLARVAADRLRSLRDG